MTAKTLSTCVQTLEKIQQKVLSKNFVRIPDQQILNDLSIDVKAILFYLMSKPHNWRPMPDDIKKILRLSTRRYLAANRHLRDLGLISDTRDGINRQGKKNGRFLKFDRPLDEIPFTKIPNHYFDLNLKPLALNILIYLTNRDVKVKGWIPRVTQICKQFNITQKQFRTAAKELSNVGALSYNRSKFKLEFKIPWQQDKNHVTKINISKRAHIEETKINKLLFINTLRNLSTVKQSQGKLRMNKLPNLPLANIADEKRDEFNKKIKKQLGVLCKELAKVENRPVDEFKQDLYNSVIKANNLTNNLSYVTYLLYKIKTQKNIKKPIGRLIEMLATPDNYVCGFEQYCESLFDEEKHKKKIANDKRHKQIDTEITQRLEDIVYENFDIIEPALNELGHSLHDSRKKGYRDARAKAFHLIELQSFEDEVVKRLIDEKRELNKILGYKPDYGLERFKTTAELKKEREERERAVLEPTQMNADKLFAEIRNKVAEKLNLRSRKLDSKAVYTHVRNIDESEKKDLLVRKLLNCQKSAKLSEDADKIALAEFKKLYPYFPLPSCLDNNNYIETETQNGGIICALEPVSDAHCEQQSVEIKKDYDLKEKTIYTSQRNAEARRKIENGEIEKYVRPPEDMIKPMMSSEETNDLLGID